MEQSEIICMAREACAPNQTFNSDEEWVKRFAALVAERTLTNQKAHYYQEGYEAGQHDEREACAKVCDDRAFELFEGTDLWIELIDCAAAIRARGENGTA